MQDYTDILSLKKGYIEKLKELETETNKLKTLAKDVAEKECAYRKAKAVSFLTLIAAKNSATAAKILMDGETAQIRLFFKISDGVLKSAKENIKRIHSNIEAYRTLISIAKSEINIR